MPFNLNATINYTDYRHRDTKTHIKVKRLPINKIKKYISTIKKSKDSLGPILQYNISLHCFLLPIHFHLWNWLASSSFFLFICFYYYENDIVECMMILPSPKFSFFSFTFPPALFYFCFEIWKLESEKCFKQVLLLSIHWNRHITDARRKWQLNY